MDTSVQLLGLLDALDKQASAVESVPFTRSRRNNVTPVRPNLPQGRQPVQGSIPPPQTINPGAPGYVRSDVIQQAPSQQNSFWRIADIAANGASWKF